MNQFTKLLQQAQALFAGMTPQTRVLAILMVAAIGVSVGFLVQGYQSSTAAMEYLFDGQSFSLDELDRMEVALSSNGLRKYERMGNRIRVPVATRDEYVKAIADGKAMPRALGSSMDQALNANSFLESAALTDSRIRRAKMADIEFALKQLPFVREASVQFDDYKDGFAATRKRSASISIFPQGGIPMTGEQKRGIIAFVQKSIANLNSKDIVLFDLSQGHATVGTDDPITNEQSQFYQVKEAREREYLQKAETLLADIPNVRIAVNVELDPTLTEEMEQLNYNEKPTTVQSTTTKKDTESQKANSGGRPGTEPNALANKSASLGAAADQMAKSKETSETQRGVTGNTLTATKKAGLQMTRATFSVSVPSSYYKNALTLLWQEKNAGKPLSTMPAITEADLKNIKTDTETNIRAKLTAILQKGAPGEDAFPRVVVTESLDMPVPEIKPPGITDYALNWLSTSWQTLALFGLAFTALISLRSFVKSAPASDDSAFERGFDIPLDDATEIDLESLTLDEEELLEPGNPDDVKTLKLQTTGGDIKDELTSIVRQNPDAAATLLRSWISNDV